MKFCSRPFEFFYVLPDGRVRVCGWTDGTIGNLIEEDFEEIWHGRRAEIQREAIRNGSFSFCRSSSCHYLENDELPDISEEEFKKRTIALDSPAEISVSCDYTCNHTCPSCREHIFKGSDEYKDNLDIMLNKLKPYLPAAKYVSTNGNGEVFANPQMIQMLQNLHPQKKDTIISIETNGTLFTRENWEKISHIGENHVNVTVTPNSFVKSTFMALNGGHDTYDQMIENLYFIKELREKELVNSFAISIVFQDRNFNELPQFARKCIEDFKVDKVTIKPLYHWFGLSEDLFWMKDVLNPCHPYHKEFLEIRKDPIFNHEKVYMWGGDNLHEARKHPAYKYKEQLEIVMGCLDDVDLDYKIREHALNNNIEKAYIYGDEQLSVFLYRMLKPVIKIEGFIARDINRKEICGTEVKSIWEYSPKPDDVIYLINYKNYEIIKKDLMMQGFKGKIIRLDDFIRDMGIDIN